VGDQLPHGPARRLDGCGTGGPIPEAPDIDLVRACAALPCPVFAEGRYRTPNEAWAARAAGATAVVVGSAITRPEHVTGWFASAMAEPLGPRAAS
jgi:putative N-acetylmannosamine-6-phosphate epimerase